MSGSASPTRSAPVTRAKERTKDNEVYELLRTRIFRGEYRPAERLREEELCREFGVTRTPLRLALRRLEHEGLLVGEPFRGVHVREVSRDEIAPLFDMREVLEGLAARNVAASGKNEILDGLRQLAQGCDETAEHEQWEQYFAADKAFHWELIQQSNNPRLIEVMEVYNFQLRTFSFHDHYLPYVVEQLTVFKEGLIHQHVELVEIMASRDSEAAENALRHHIRKSKAVVLEAYEQWTATQSTAK